MKVLAIHERFGLESLQLADRAKPRPGPGEILIAMKAASLNYRDWLMVRGLYNPTQPLPLIPGSDGVGHVVALGEGVTRFAIGDRVSPIFAQEWIAGRPTKERLRSTLGGPIDGVLCEYMSVPACSAVRVPAHLSDVQAATLPCAALTAWTALVVEGRVKAGDTVLIQGSGGVALFALQFAKLLGARAIVTSKSDEKLEKMRFLGADACINYRAEPAWGRKARELSGGEGVDLVVELGGGQTLAESLKAVCIGGTIAVIGVLSGVAAPLNLLPVLMGHVRLQGILVGNRDNFEAMNRAISEARLEPVVHEVFPFAECRAALEMLGAGEHFGKVCLTI